ncbi:hypothetical protein [Aquabacterium sp.]|uniref:alpha-amylase inhibitor/seed storage/lipid transfer family protein n=1 Tax=Aquabacterium sp. TaxID=1872578 RepID=UPI0034379356
MNVLRPVGSWQELRRCRTFLTGGNERPERACCTLLRGFPPVCALGDRARRARTERTSPGHRARAAPTGGGR